MATIKEIGSLREKLEKVFMEFFKDKYDKETLSVIFKDLFYLIRNYYITEISFCYYDNISGKITEGYVFNIDHKSSDPGIIKCEVSVKVPALETTSEKLLFVKLSDEYKDNKNKINEIFKSLDNEWDYTNRPDIKQKGSLKDFFSANDLKLKIVKINGRTK